MKREKVKLTAAAAAMIMAAGTCLVPAAAADMTALQAAPAGVFAQEAGERSNRELNAQSMNSQYLLPDSDTYYITEADISWMDDDELLLARNEFYARRGRKFVIKWIREYFERQGWYEGTIEPEKFSPELFNRYETANIDFIVAYEAGRQRQREKNKAKNNQDVTVLEEFGGSAEVDGEYIGITDLYADSIREDWSDEELEMAGINSLTGNFDTADSVGSLYRDLDGDGKAELLIGAVDPELYGTGAVFEIYTIEDGIPVEVAASSEDSMLYLCADDTIRRDVVYEDGRWEIEYYDLVDGELVGKDLLVMDESRNAAEPWFVIDKTKTDWEDMDFSVQENFGIPDSALKHITEKEAMELRGSYPSLELPFEPL
ncbi:MAG: YARHG domain-containing protein [Eubacteriales bacterium]|nr:YARHG domain-containing protein [Eubacteriales bacterium]